MTTYRPIDSKREEFRKYLERAGVMDALTKVLVLLYEEPEKPEDPLEYVRQNLGDKRATMAEAEAMKTDLEMALLKIQSLEQEIVELRAKLPEREDGDADGDGSTDSHPQPDSQQPEHD